MSAEEDRLLRESIKFQENLGGLYAAYLLQKIAGIMNALEFGDFDLAIEMADALYTLATPFRAHFPGRPSDVIKARLDDLKNFSYQRVLGIPDKLVLSEDSTINSLERQRLGRLREQKIIRETLHEIVGSLMDGLHEQNFLLRYDPRFGLQDLSLMTECKRCGHAVLMDDNFCRSCGAKLK